MARFIVVEKNVGPMGKSPGVEASRRTMGRAIGMHPHAAEVCAHMGFDAMADGGGQG
jgi:hypothetical protein